LPPFGIVRYQEPISSFEELTKKLDFYEKEYQRSQKLLENSNFLAHTPPHLINQEKDKLIYYQKQKEDLWEKLKKLK